MTALNYKLEVMPRHFSGYSLGRTGGYLQAEDVHGPAHVHLKLEVTRSSETSVHIRITLRYIPEDID
jgi:hypothetical protein